MRTFTLPGPSESDRPTEIPVSEVAIGPSRGHLQTSKTQRGHQRLRAQGYQNTNINQREFRVFVRRSKHLSRYPCRTFQEGRAWTFHVDFPNTSRPSGTTRRTSRPSTMPEASRVTNAQVQGLDNPRSSPNTGLPDVTQDK